MYVDDLALVSDSPARTPSHVKHCVHLCRETVIQPQRRQVICDGLQRTQARSSRNWYLGNEEVEEAPPGDSQNGFPLYHLPHH